MTGPQQIVVHRGRRYPVLDRRRVYRTAPQILQYQPRNGKVYVVTTRLPGFVDRSHTALAEQLQDFKLREP